MGTKVLPKTLSALGVLENLEWEKKTNLSDFLLIWQVGAWASVKLKNRDMTASVPVKERALRCYAQVHKLTLGVFIFFGWIDHLWLGTQADAASAAWTVTCRRGRGEELSKSCIWHSVSAWNVSWLRLTSRGRELQFYNVWKEENQKDKLTATMTITNIYYSARSYGFYVYNTIHFYT